jgi:hypothetical protein
MLFAFKRVYPAVNKQIFRNRSPALARSLCKRFMAFILIPDARFSPLARFNISASSSHFNPVPAAMSEA